jgi:hypothetical protein
VAEQFCGAMSTVLLNSSHDMSANWLTPAVQPLAAALIASISRSDCAKRS